MIEVHASTALMLYLAFTTLTTLSLWLWRHWHAPHPTLHLEKEELYQCEFCSCAYLAKRNNSLNRCPQCHSLNRDNRYQPKNYPPSISTMEANS